MKKRNVLFSIVMCMLIVIMLVPACTESTPTPTATAKPTATATGTATAKPTATATPPPKVKKVAVNYGGTSASSGGYASVVAEMNIIEKYSGETGVQVIPTIMETGASIENLKLLKRGDCQFGMAGMPGSYRAYNGLDEFEGMANPNLRILLCNSTTGHSIFVTKESGVTTLEELEGKPFGCGLTGSETESVTVRFFDANNIKPNWFRGTTGAARDATLNRQIIGYVKSGLPDASVQEVAASLPIRLLSINQAQMDKAQAKYPGLFRSMVPMPPNVYPDSNPDGGWTFPITMGEACNKDLPNDVAYAIVSALLNHIPEWVAGYPTLKNPECIGSEGPEVILKYATIPLHAATVRWFVENGYDVPENLIPPEYYETQGK